jgi:SpoVK/Ycf46/Vps4 family AAA+-type ATPase
MKSSSLLWSDTQADAFRRLLKIGETFFRAQIPRTGLRPRLDSLVVGSSGSGKSFLARAVANELEVPLLKLTFGEWLVAGSRGCSTTTIELVRKFIDVNERGIIQIDELDKARAGFAREWSIAAYAELFSLLDRTTADGNLGARWEPVHGIRLRDDFWFIGCGTWQDVWTNQGKKRLGFNQTAHTLLETDIRDQIERQALIPLELLRRFCRQLIILLPATEDDFRKASAQFGICKLANALGETLDFAEAATSGAGARWLEETLASLLVLAWEKDRRDLLPEKLTISAPEPAPSPEADTSDDIPF